MIMCRRSMATYNTMGSGVSTTRRTIFQIDDSFIESNLPHEADLLRNIGDHRCRLVASMHTSPKLVSELEETASKGSSELRAVDATDARWVTEVPSL
jgi:hypothetical protein